MTRADILPAVKGFLALFEDSTTSEDREAALRLALDRLALAYHFAEAPYDGRDHPAPPDAGYDALRARIAPLFPGLGYYNVALGLEENVGDPSMLGVGDALDDLVDIARDLQSVVLRWETTSEADALWHFRFTYASHWGKHLRSLQLYLHEHARSPT